MNLVYLFKFFLIFCCTNLISCGFWSSTFFSLFNLESNLQLNSNQSKQKDSQHLIDSIIQETFEQIVKEYQFEDNQDIFNFKSRNKRSTYSNLNKVINDPFGVYRLTSISPLFSLCPHSAGIELINFQQWTLCICFSSFSPFNITIGTLDISRRSFNSWPALKFLSTFYSEGPVIVKAFSLENEKTFHLLIADESRPSPGIDVLEIDEYFNFKKISAPNIDHPTSFQLFYPKGFTTQLKTLYGSNFPHLIVANQFLPQKSSYVYKSVTKLFHWKNDSRTFDEYDVLDSYLVKDICTFSIMSNDYIVIINHQAGIYQHQVDSEVFKFNVEKGKYQSLQKISTQGAVDCEIFTLGTYKEREYFLAIANQYDYVGNQLNYFVNSAIYRFVVDKFVPFQCIKTQGAKQIKAIKGPDSSFVLVISTQVGIQLFQYNGWIFEESKISHNFKNYPIQNINNLRFPNETMLIINDPRISYNFNVYRMNFIQDHSLSDWYKKSLSWCNDTLSAIDNRNLSYLDYLFQNVYYIDQPQTIEINGDLIYTRDLDVSEALLTSNVQVYGTREIDYLNHQYVLQLENLEKRLQALEKSEKNLKVLFNLAFKLYGDQEISGSYSFDQFNLKCYEKVKCQIDEINAKTLNTRNIFNLTNNFIRLDRDENIFGSLRFQNVISKSKLTTLSINNLNPSTFVTKTGHHVIKGETVLESFLTVDDFKVNGTINGHVINRDVILVSDGYQQVESVLIFGNSIKVRNLQITGLITNFNTSFDDFLNNIIIKNGYHPISGVKHFKHLSIDNLYLKPGTNLNGIDIVDLYDNLFWITGNQTITAPFTFTNLIINGNIFAKGTVNNIPFSKNFYALSKGTTILKASKIFFSPVKIKTAFIQHSINRIKNLNQSLDLLLKTKAQKVTGSKTFFNIYLNANANVMGTVNGIRLSSFYQHYKTAFKVPLHAGKKRVNGHLEIYGPLTITGLINGINLNQLFYETFKLNDTQIPNINFRFQNLFASYINTQSINGYNPLTDFLTLNTPQVLNGTKIFTQNLLINNNLNIKNLNGLSVNKTLFNSLYRTDSQLITGFKIFYGDLYVDNLNAKFINEVDMSDLVLINRSSYIIGNKQFEQVKVMENTITNHIPSLIFLNNYSFHEIYFNSLRRNLPQQITGQKHFAEFIVPKGQNLVTSNINNYNLKTLIQNVIYKDVNYVQEIYGRKYFYTSVDFEKFNFTDSFDNISSNEFNHGWLHRHKNQVIFSNINFLSDVRINENLVVRNNINNIDIGLLNKSIVKTNEPVTIQNSVSIFEVFVNGYVNVEGTINGMRLSKDLVRKNSSSIQVLTGYKYFMKGLEIENYLDIVGLINGISLRQMCSNAVNRYVYQYFNQSLTIKGDLIVPALYLYGSINNVNLELLNRSIILSQNTLIAGKKKFKNLIINGPISLMGKINNFDLKYLSDNCLSKTKPQTIKSQIVFLNGLILNGPTQIKNHLKTGKNLINGINLSNLINTSLLNTGYQELKGNYVFQNKVYFKESFDILGSTISTSNGFLNLKHDVMLRNRPNIVNIPIIFKSSVIFSSKATMNRKKKFGGLNLDTFENTAVFKQPKMQFINDRKHFSSLEVDELFINGYMNNVLFQEKYLLLSDKSEVVDSKMIFKNGLQVKGNIKIKGTINNINLTNLEHRLVLKGRKNIITSPIYFNVKPKIINMTSLGLFGGLNFSNVNYQNNIVDKMNKIRMKLSFQDNKLQKLNTILQYQAFCFEYYEFLDLIKNSRLLLTGSKSKIFSGFYLLDLSQREQYHCDSIQVRKYDGNVYNLIQNIITYRPISVIDFWYKNEKYLIITSENPLTNANKYAINCLQREASTNFNMTGKGNSMIQIMKHDKRKNQFLPISRQAINKPKDVKFLETPFKRPCVIFTYPFNAKTGDLESPSIYCLTINSNYLQAHLEYIETLESKTKGADKVAVLLSNYSLTTFLVTINKWQTLFEFGNVQIFKLDESDQTFGKSIQSIKAFFPTAVYLVESVQEPIIYLWLSDGKNKKIGNKPITKVFRYYPSSSGEPFKETQKIWDEKEENIILIDSTIMPDYSLLIFLLTESNLLKLYKSFGISGFQLINTLNTRDSNLFIVINTYSIYDHLNGHHLLLSKSKQEENEPSNNNVYILKSKMRGEIF